MLFLVFFLKTLRKLLSLKNSNLFCNKKKQQGIKMKIKQNKSSQKIVLLLKIYIYIINNK